MTRPTIHPFASYAVTAWEQRHKTVGHGICSLVAWSAITGDSIFTAHRILEQSAGKTLTGWDKSHPRCGWAGIWDAFHDRGWKWTPLRDEQGKTVSRFCKDCDPKKLYILHIHNGAHCIAVRNGKAYDWTQGRRFIITGCFEMQPIS